eukprot:1181312-Prorocentrum_minimum.AAC.7
MLHYAPDSTAFGSDTAASCCQHPPYPCWQLPTTEPQWKNCPTGPPQSVTPLIPRSEPKPYIDATTTITQYVRGGGDRFGCSQGTSSRAGGGGRAEDSPRWFEQPRISRSKEWQYGRSTNDGIATVALPAGINYYPRGESPTALGIFL